MKRLSFLLLGAFLLLLAACGDTEGGSDSADASKDKNDTEVNEDSSSKEDSESNLGKRSNPVPLGETVTIPGTVYSEEGDSANGEFSISISNIVRGQEAMDFLLKENEFNEQPPEGYEWMIFDVNLEASIDNPDMPYFAAPSFNVIDSSGSPVTQDIYPTFNSGEFGWTDVYDGGAHSGKAGVIVPVDEDVIVEYSDIDLTAFFNVK